MTTDNLAALSDAEIQAAIDTLHAELARRKPAQKMRITYTYSAYNHRRYQRPWIARITAWPVGGRPKLEWGRYLGNHEIGSGGEAEIMAQPGDIVRSGQKDYRGGNSNNDWLIVEADGSLRKISETEARSRMVANVLD